MSNFVIAVHGGAGTILREQMTAEMETVYLHSLEAALNAGYNLLAAGVSSTEAVQAATVVLENNILFNAGRGSVFTKKGLQEMDAAIMEGNGRRAGAVAGVRNIRNPILLAVEVMRNSEHVFLCGDGANEFAKQRGIALEPDEYFFSQFRYDQWTSIRDSNQYALDHGLGVQAKLSDTDPEGNEKFGTVGAVACDRDGNIAAATSTGGMTNKQYGRIGDTPLIGAGTYANNKTCAISCTGHGEPFIRAVAAYDVSCLMEYKGLSLTEAMNIVVNQKLPLIEGEGGMIGVDAEGQVAMLFNSDGMYRGSKTSDGNQQLKIYR